MKLNKIFGAAALLMCISCSDENALVQDSANTIPIEIASTYPVSGGQTRATDNGFITDDAVGVFIVDYDSEGNPGTPAVKGNRASNVKYTYDGSRWTSNYQVYWANRNTPADFYGYYPFDMSMQSVTAYNFAVSKNQAEEASSGHLSGYERSDLLRAKAEKMMPTTETVTLPYRHLMAGVTIMLEAGTGFTAEEWVAADKIVQIENTVLGGTVDIAEGTTTLGSGNPQTIIPLDYNGTWRAVLFPQTIAAGTKLVSVTVDGYSYFLTKDAATTFYSGKMHNMTITVNRSADGTIQLSLKADDIVAWIDDPDLHDGLTYIYTVVSLDQAGTLKEEVDKVCDDYRNLTNLKIVGRMNEADREFIAHNLLYLECVNMQKVVMEDSILSGFGGLKSLHRFVYPERGIKKVARGCFAETIISGNITYPEGVEIIEFGTYWGCPTYGSITIPSTVKYFADPSGYNEKMSGELHFPEGIEYIGAPTGNFSGSLYFPSSLKSIEGSFSYPNITGTLTIPRCLTNIPELMFAGIGCSQVEFHDGITEIERGAFQGANLQGELVLPPNLQTIGSYAFNGAKINKIIFPDALRSMDDGHYPSEGVFADCQYLMGTVELPKNVARIPKGCFCNCTAITGLYIPKGVDVIEESAFKNCYSLNSIVCENPEPPVVCDGAFFGVPKDNFTIEVPKGSVEKYREARGWSEFKRIAEYSNFVCRPMNANALNTVHQEQLVLNADGAWQVERKPDWVTLSKTNGTGKTELTLTFNQMSHGNGNRQDSIIFTMPDEDHRTFCVVSQYDYDQEEDSYLALQKATKGNRGGINVVFVGDGYDGEDISNGNYLNLVKEQTEHFFGLEPYKSLRDYFNVYVTYPLSQEKGVNTMNTYVNNHFGTLYGYDGTLFTINQLLTEDDEVRNYVVEHTPLKQDDLGASLIILVPNSDAYSGVTYYAWYGSPISICPPSNRPYPQDTRGVVQHEAGGHGFAYLGDEEIIYSAWATPGIKGIIDERKSWGWYANLSTTSGLHSVSWADFVFDPRYSNEVDVFEGGFEYMRGVFRPEQNSCMNYGIPYYNAPSRLEIMRRVFDYAGESFSMDYFYAHDSKEWGDTPQTRAGAHNLSGSSYAGSNQHRMPQILKDKQMGNSVRLIRKNLKSNNK